MCAKRAKKAKRTSKKSAKKAPKKTADKSLTDDGTSTVLPIASEKTVSVKHTKPAPVPAEDNVVVINTAARCFVLPGIEMIIPGRNIRDRVAMNAAMKNPSVALLPLSLEAIGDPEKTTQSIKINNIKTTFNVDDLKELRDKEDDMVVRAAIANQIDLIKPPKKKDASGESADESGE